MRGSHRRAVVIGGAGRVRGYAAGSPRAAGRVPRGGRHGRAKRKLLRTKPRWGWSNWCQPISPRGGPETPAVPEGGHLPRHLRPEAARPGPAPPLPAPPAPGPGEEPSAPPWAEFKPRGEPHRPHAELSRCRPGIPATLRWPRLPAVGIPDASSTTRHGGGKCPTATAGELPGGPRNVRLRLAPERRAGVTGSRRRMMRCTSGRG